MASTEIRPKERTRARKKPAPAPSANGRLHREAPRREHPIREPSMMLRPAGEKGAGGGKGFVEQGVEMAYRVIEEFMQRGRQAAGRAGTAWRKSEEGMQNNQQNMAS